MRSKPPPPLAETAQVIISIEVKDGTGYGARQVAKTVLEEQVVLEDAGEFDRYPPVRDKVRDLADNAISRTDTQVDAHNALVKAEQAKAEAERPDTPPA
jgi:hypothetical protein